jgi:hypothetical protein
VAQQPRQQADNSHPTSGAIRIVGLCLLVIGATGELCFTTAVVVGRTMRRRR